MAKSKATDSRTSKKAATLVKTEALPPESASLAAMAVSSDASPAPTLQNDEPDEWAAAMAEQAEVHCFSKEENTASPKGMTGEAESAMQGLSAARLAAIPIKLTVEMGETRIALGQLSSLGQGAVIDLHGCAGEPLTLKANGFPIARGEMVVVNDRFGIRLTEVLTDDDRFAAQAAERTQA